MSHDFKFFGPGPVGSSIAVICFTAIIGFNVVAQDTDQWVINAILNSGGGYVASTQIFTTEQAAYDYINNHLDDLL